MKKILLPAIAACSLLTCGLAGADTIYVSNSGSNSITQINSDGSLSTFVPSSPLNLSGPTGLAIDSSGNVYASNNGTQLIAKFSSTGDFLGNVGTAGIYPRGLAFDSAGNLFVANQGSGTVEEFKSGGGTKILASSLPSPNALAFDSYGNLFVTDGTGNAITEITPGGIISTVSFTGPALAGPNGLAFDSAGNIFVVNTATPSIEEITGGVGKIFATDGLDMPKAVAVDSLGNVFVTDYGDNSVTEYDSSGKLINTFSGGFTGPCGIVILADGTSTTVPEPSTYALLLAGVVVLFYFNRRRLQPVKI